LFQHHDAAVVDKIDETGQNLEIDLDELADIGLPTLSTTSRPSDNRAAWTCPIEALPSGFGSKKAKI
jgi:hypothetical protein